MLPGHSGLLCQRYEYFFSVRKSMLFVHLCDTEEVDFCILKPLYHVVPLTIINSFWIACINHKSGILINIAALIDVFHGHCSYLHVFGVFAFHVYILSYFKTDYNRQIVQRIMMKTVQNYTTRVS